MATLTVNGTSKEALGYVAGMELNRRVPQGGSLTANGVTKLTMGEIKFKANSS